MDDSIIYCWVVLFSAWVWSIPVLQIIVSCQWSYLGMVVSIGWHVNNVAFVDFFAWFYYHSYRNRRRWVKLSVSVLIWVLAVVGIILLIIGQWVSFKSTYRDAKWLWRWITVGGIVLMVISAILYFMRGGE